MPSISPSSASARSQKKWRRQRWSLPPHPSRREGLAVGVDNLRHDVALSPRFVDAARAQIMRLIVRHGELEGLLAAEAPQKSQAPSWMRDAAAGPNREAVRGPADPSDWKPFAG